MRTPALSSRRRRGLVGLTVAALVASPLAFGLTSPANADVSTKIASFPYGQGWPATAITVTDSWSGVAGVQGYRGEGVVAAPGVNPQTVTGESAVANDTDVNANQANPATFTTGGVTEFDGITDPSIALAGSGTADAPYVAFHLDLTGKSNPTFAFDARDLDPSSDNAIQQIAVQYRVGAFGPYTNMPAGYIADATTADTATQVTPTSVVLPDNVNNQASVFVRVITTDAVGSDEWVGIDNVSITDSSVPAALALTNPGAQSGTVGTPITPLVLEAEGGTPPYTVVATDLPDGLTFDAATDTISGTPTTVGDSTVAISVTDGAGGTDTDSFVWTITAAASLTPIAAIQGTGATTPLDGQNVKTQGVVTAAYPTGGLNGFYIQTPGADTANASDAIFVYGGTSGFAAYPAVGDSVEVTGQAAEFSGATQIVSSNSGVTSIAPLGTVTPKTVIPGTDCALPGTACLASTELDDVREVVESELFQPTAAWTATDVYDGGPYYSNGTNSTAFRGEIGVAANSVKPLVAPTELIDAQSTAMVAERKRYNDAHRIILDDASSLTYSTTQNSNLPFPWFTANHSVRVGAGITFPKPVVFTFGFNAWRILPQAQVTGNPTGTINFAQTRPAAPENVGGDVKLATFNVLNFFPTTGEEFVASGLGTCTYFNDRDGARVSINSCTNNGPRGAANDANLVRQRAKIVAAINTADADIVSLEELENSVQFGKDRDFAINALVSALNADAGAGTWAAVPSPAASELPPLSEQDVIRNGFIYKPGNVALVGPSDVLADLSTGTEAFADAREPVAQAFKQVGTPDADAFAVIVNHFKSKGSGTPDPDGQGNANDRRVLQANALVTFANEFKTARGITRVFLAGDFNAYSEEDPIQVLNASGYTNLESSSDPDEETYNFDGMVGSLDHVLANAPALADVNAVDVWDINGYESVYYEYARFNTNVTNLYAPNPYRSSDHSPEIVGINTSVVVEPEPSAVSTTVTGTAAPIQYGKAGSVAVTVAPATATGSVTGAEVVISRGAEILGTTTLTGGAGTVALAAKSLPVGTHTLTLIYSGDAKHKPSTGSVTVVISKADATVKARVKPKKIFATKTRARIFVTVTAEGITPGGKVKVKIGKKVYRRTLQDGKAVVKLTTFTKPGTYKAKVRYIGNGKTEEAWTRITIRVKRR